MKKYTVELSPVARKKLRKLDAPVRKRITNYIKNELEGCENPRFRGRNLTDYPNANRRYRVGDYRIISDIQDDKIIILVVKVDSETTFISKFFPSTRRDFF